jgi:uncharacterized protein YndB with AHSA1/START domain
MHHYLTVETSINMTVDKVWKLWTTPADIAQWNNPSADWHSPKVETDLREGGSFLYRMETKDGRIGFDHSGKYDSVIQNELIEYTVSDGRKSITRFVAHDDCTTVIETFEPEKETPVEEQRKFVQAVLHNFKLYAESVQ